MVDLGFGTPKYCLICLDCIKQITGRYNSLYSDHNRQIIIPFYSGLLGVETNG
jgi:hypothetical protein